MAITRTNVVPLTKSSDAFGTGAFTPAGFTPGAGVKLEIKLWAMSNSNDALAGSDLTVAITGLTFSVLHQTVDTDSAGWGYAMKAWLSSVTPSGALSVTFDAGTFNVQNYWYQIDAISGEAASPLGATAKGSDADGEGPLSLTLSAAPAADSIVVAMATVAHDNTVGGIDPGSGWTEEGNVARNGWGDVQCQRRTGSTSTAVDWADLNNGGTTPLGGCGMAFEIKAAATGSPFTLTQVGSIGLQGVLGISAGLQVKAVIPIEPVAPIALTGTLGISGDIQIHTQRWRVPTNAPEGTPVHIIVFSGASPDYTIHVQGVATVDASGFAELPKNGGAVGDKAFALVHNYDGNTATVSIYGGPCIATIVELV